MALRNGLRNGLRVKFCGGLHGGLPLQHGLVPGSFVGLCLRLCTGPWVRVLCGLRLGLGWYMGELVLVLVSVLLWERRNLYRLVLLWPSVLLLLRRRRCRGRILASRLVQQELQWFIMKCGFLL